MLNFFGTKTKATLRTNKQELYSVIENNDVEFVVELNNNKEESDIYGTSVYEIVLPNTITDVKIKDTNMLYNIIRILVSGTQTAVNNGNLTNRY